MWHNQRQPNVPRTFAPHVRPVRVPYLAGGMPPSGLTYDQEPFDDGQDPAEFNNDFVNELQQIKDAQQASADQGAYLNPDDQVNATIHNALPQIPNAPLPKPYDQRAVDYQNAMQTEAALAAERPVLNKPKWWERAGAAALGAGAGWSNAASRTKQPIDIEAAGDNILHPGYQSKLAQWQSRMVPAQEQVKILGEQVGAQRAADVAESQIEQRRAQAEAERKRGLYWDQLGNARMVEVTPELSEASGGIFKPGQQVPAATATELARIAAGKYEKPEKTIAVTDTELAKRIGVKVGTLVPYSLYQAGVNAANRPERNLNPSDVLLHPKDFTPDQVKKAQEMFDKEHRAAVDPNIPKPMTNAQKVQIESRKNNRLNMLDRKTKTAIALDPEREAELRAAQEDQKQEIQDQYENEITAITGSSPGHFDYTSDAPVRTTKTAATGGAGRGPSSASTQVETIPEAARKQLKPGVVKIFGNGQEWTLENGKPKRVK